MTIRKVVSEVLAHLVWLVWIGFLVLGVCAVAALISNQPLQVIIFHFVVLLLGVAALIAGCVFFVYLIELTIKVAKLLATTIRRWGESSNGGKPCLRD